MTPRTFTLQADELHKLPKLLHSLGPGDCIQLADVECFAAAQFNRFMMATATGRIRANQGMIELYDVTYVSGSAPRVDTRPNRGPQGHVENWKRRGRK